MPGPTQRHSPRPCNLGAPGIRAAQLIAAREEGRADHNETQRDHRSPLTCCGAAQQDG